MMEMDLMEDVVKKFLDFNMYSVATWTDKKGLSLLTPKYEVLRTPVLIDTNRTYIVSTIIQDPFMMLKPSEYSQREEYTGFCKELMELISSQIGIQYEIRIVRDGNFGIEVSHNNWNGLVGEVLRKPSWLVDCGQWFVLDDAIVALVSKVPFNKDANSKISLEA
ncbi:jg5468 [Pararge aegeria aegeria]|uniref:Jg5468 protein n=1 Tax=Pararge aegeria aegeria TaxID=348720 RepID=A0A8S4QSB6_9NEOP|nr:jg5468 [Pararge aegeria aegeria]